MKVITLHEPWASWILWGWKTIETRLHDRFRGLRGCWIGIHAGLRFDRGAVHAAKEYLSIEQLQKILSESENDGWLHGRMVCTATIYQIRPVTVADSPLALADCSGGDRYGLVLTNIMAIAGHPKVRGQRGIWRWNAA